MFCKSVFISLSSLLSHNIILPFLLSFFFISFLFLFLTFYLSLLMSHSYFHLNLYIEYLIFFCPLLTFFFFLIIFLFHLNILVFLFSCLQYSINCNPGQTGCLHLNEWWSKLPTLFHYFPANKYTWITELFVERPEEKETKRYRRINIVLQN